MNEYDTSNFNFLMSADPATLKDWYDKMGPDDHAYAAELLRQASAEMVIRKLDLINTDDLADAHTALAKFRLP